MLEQFFDSPLHVQGLRNGPSGFLLEGFSQELRHLGYAKVTARRYIRVAARFIHWAEDEAIPTTNFDEQAIAHFDEHLTQSQGSRYCRKERFDLLRGVRLFVGHVCGTGVSIGRIREPAPHDPVLLARFHEWMREQRGTGDVTLANYSTPLRDLLKRVGEDLRRLDAQSLREFVLEQTQNLGASGIKNCTAALRMFARFLIAEGMCKAGLDGAVPVVAHWRLCKPKKSKVSSRPVIRAQRWASAIAPFCFYCHAWHFGRAISFSCVWKILIGKLPGFP